MAERAGFEPAVRLPVRQFSKLLLSATQPPLRLLRFYNIYHFSFKSSFFLKKIQNFSIITDFIWFIIGINPFFSDFYCFKTCNIRNLCYFK